MVMLKKSNYNLSRLQTFMVQTFLGQEAFVKLPEQKSNMIKTFRINCKIHLGT